MRGNVYTGTFNERILMSYDASKSTPQRRRIALAELPADHPYRLAALNKKPPTQKFSSPEKSKKVSDTRGTQGTGQRKLVVILFVLVGAVLFVLWQVRSYF